MNKKSTVVNVKSRTLKMISTLICDYPELGYKTTEDFVNCAIDELLKRKGLEIGQLQTWLRSSTKN